MSLAPARASRLLRDLCALAPVVPVLVIRELRHARPLAEALIRGGLPVLEVTLRTPCALEAIGEMRAVPGGHVGAGTLLTAQDARAARAAGACFGVSPGATDDLLGTCAEEELPLLPGAVTASEAMRLLSRGHDMLKFFPAEAAGGAAALKALGGPLPQIAFCPTGGITPGNAGTYLALDNVACVGGSWVAPEDLVARGDWAGIEALARTTAGISRRG